MQALELAFALLYLISPFGFDFWVISGTAYMAIVVLKDDSPRLRNIIVWAILIGAILTAFFVVVTNAYLVITAYRAHLVTNGLWHVVAANFLYLSVIGVLTSLPVINEARRRKRISAS